KLRRYAKHCDRSGYVVIEPEQYSERGLADARRFLQDGLEHRLQLPRRAGDDAQHLRGGSLLLQRLGQIVGALPQLIEQPRVLDRDDGLVGERGEQLDLILSEGLDLRTRQE